MFSITRCLSKESSWVCFISLDTICVSENVVHFYSYISTMFLEEIEKSTESLFTGMLYIKYKNAQCCRQLDVYPKRAAGSLNLFGQQLYQTSLSAYAQSNISGVHRNITTFYKGFPPYSYTLHLRPLTFTSTMPTLTTTDPPEDELDEKPDFNPVVSGLYSTPRGS